MKRTAIIETDAKIIGRHVSQELPSVQPQIRIRNATPEEYDLPSRVYVEPENMTLDRLEYERTGKDQGLVIIFNQVHFKSPDREVRKGSTKDVIDLIDTLGRLGYNFDENYLFSNLGSQEIKDKVEEIANKDLTDRNSLIVFFLSHGDMRDMLATQDGTINTREIWSVLGEHKDLHNKPKLFVFQACKGNKPSPQFDTKPLEGTEYSISHIYFASHPLPPDILICYSGVEGMVTYRHKERGTWFIQEICRNFSMYGRREDVVTLFTRVAKCVALYKHQEGKQMPVLTSTLSKKFYLSVNKDRTNKLALYELHTKVWNAVNNLKRTIENIEDGKK